MGDNMFTTDEIFVRMMNGESMDSIAKEMTEALNAAKAKKDAEDKRKAEEEAKAKREAVVNEAAEKAANAVNELIRVMYPEMADATEQLTGRMLRDMVDSSYTLVKEVEKAIPMFEKLTAGEPKEIAKRGNRANFSTIEEISDADVESILNSFMKSL